MITAHDTLLMVEDNPDDIELTRRTVARSNIINQLMVVTGGDAALRENPSVLVTSRAAPEDRRRGQEIGARGDIAKPDGCCN